mmetsp:Transcript_121540/g.223885  ORF Transcript_121540/g.223885 Transcript_121540/m.223885 type:complete len:426 (-) Transcript_121540:22-1299(-)
MPSSADFVDYYAILGCSPDSSAADLKRAYYDKVREFHPDKRRTNTGFGQRQTQDINEAWEVLQDPAKREAYDARWHRAQASTPRAETKRREGNDLYKAAHALSKQHGPESFTAATECLQKYQAAIVKYTEGIALASSDHRLFSNRAMCFAALKDWAKCREDASQVTRMKPDFMKGWFLLAKAKWMEGSPIAAQRDLDTGLGILPGNSELLGLQEDISEDLKACYTAGVDYLPAPRERGRGSVSRNVSISRTPPGSRVATPPPIGRTTSRNRSPKSARDQSPAPSGSDRRQRGREASSRSPGPREASSRSPGPKTSGLNRSDTAEFGEETANFGRPAAANFSRAFDAAFGGPEASPGAASPAPDYAEATFGVRPPPRSQEPPAPSNQPPPGFHRPPRDPSPAAPRPRKVHSLAGMAAKSRVGVDSP